LGPFCISISIWEAIEQKSYVGMKNGSPCYLMKRSVLNLMGGFLLPSFLFLKRSFVPGVIKPPTTRKKRKIQCGSGGGLSWNWLLMCGNGSQTLCKHYRNMVALAQLCCCRLKVRCWFGLIQPLLPPWIQLGLAHNFHACHLLCTTGRGAWLEWRSFAMVDCALRSVDPGIKLMSSNKEEASFSNTGACKEVFYITCWRSKWIQLPPNMLLSYLHMLLPNILLFNFNDAYFLIWLHQSLFSV